MPRTAQQTADWWIAFDKAEAYFKEHGTLEGLSVLDGLSSTWLSTSRRRWEGGHLETGEILALKRIGVTLIHDRKKGKVKGGELLDQTIALHTKFKGATRNTVADEDMAAFTQYQQNLSHYRSRMRQGGLSPKTAAILGLE